LLQRLAARTDWENLPIGVGGAKNFTGVSFRDGLRQQGAQVVGLGGFQLSLESSDGNA
jgi:hypothetical protein